MSNFFLVLQVVSEDQEWRRGKWSMNGRSSMPQCALNCATRFGLSYVSFVMTTYYESPVCIMTYLPLQDGEMKGMVRGSHGGTSNFRPQQMSPCGKKQQIRL
jgi:hypothetical protein